jgi:hemerythrin superfamily protein
LKNLPFDISHNRVIGYDKRKKADLEDSIARHLRFLVDHYDGKTSPSREAYFTTLSDGRQPEEEVIFSYVKQVATEFGLQGARLRESRWSPDEGYVLSIEDAFQERVVFSVDINGRIIRKKRLT